MTRSVHTAPLLSSLVPGMAWWRRKRPVFGRVVWGLSCQSRSTSSRLFSVRQKSGWRRPWGGHKATCIPKDSMDALEIGLFFSLLLSNEIPSRD
jgi:hypothetical protein